VIVAAGPWTPGIIAGTLGQQDEGGSAGRALAVNVRIDRLLSSVAVGAKARSGPDEDPVCGGSRFLFAAPHGGKTVLGTWYSVAGGSAATPQHGVRSLLREFNQACPGLDLSARDVSGYQYGWLPLKGHNERGRPTALAERPRIIDHEVTHQVRHLLSVEAVKYTTARSVAERVVDWVFEDLGQAIPSCRTAEVPLPGVVETNLAGADGALSRSDLERAVHQEMAIKLSDIIFRRSSLGATVQLDRSLVADVARMAATELGWSTMQQEAEIEEVMQGLPLRAEEPVG
jgi:glycerol-3-phosphate dehydrogenase